MQKNRFGEVFEGPPGSTLERGTRVEKRPGTWETRWIPEQRRDPKRPAAGHMASEPTPAETQTQVGRSLNGGYVGSTTVAGRRVSTERRAAGNSPGVRSAHRYLETVAPFTGGRGGQKYVAGKGNIVWLRAGRNNANLTARNSQEVGPHLVYARLTRKRVFLKSPVLENGTPGSVRGRFGQLAVLPRWPHVRYVRASAVK